jgi:hypothetical protein
MTRSRASAPAPFLHILDPRFQRGADLTHSIGGDEAGTLPRFLRNQAALASTRANGITTTTAGVGKSDRSAGGDAPSSIAAGPSLHAVSPLASFAHAGIMARRHRPE